MKPWTTKWVPLLTFVALLAGGCEGPTGPEGPQGPSGPEGDQGPQGDQGEPGTANVYYSEWTDFQSAGWQQTTEFGRITQGYAIAEPLITQDVVDHGVVFVYVRFGGSTAPRPLPFVGYVTVSTQTQNLWHRITEGELRIIFQSLNTNDDPGTFGSVNQYRYVIIPGGLAIGGDVQSLPYGEAQLRFGLPDD